MVRSADKGLQHGVAAGDSARFVGPSANAPSYRVAPQGACDPIPVELDYTDTLISKCPRAHLGGRITMRSSKGANIVAFPFSRSERIAPEQELLKLVGGKIVAIPPVSAKTINLQEAADRIQARSCAKSDPSSACKEI